MSADPIRDAIRAEQGLCLERANASLISLYATRSDAPEAPGDDHIAHGSVIDTLGHVLGRWVVYQADPLATFFALRAVCGGSYGAAHELAADGLRVRVEQVKARAILVLARDQAKKAADELAANTERLAKEKGEKDPEYERAEADECEAFRIWDLATDALQTFDRGAPEIA